MPRISVMLFSHFGKGKAGAKLAVDMVLLKRLYFTELKLGAGLEIGVANASAVSTVSTSRSNLGCF